MSHKNIHRSKPVILIRLQLLVLGMLLITAPARMVAAAWSNLPPKPFKQPPTSLPVGATIKFTVNASQVVSGYGGVVQPGTVFYATLVASNVWELRGGSLSSAQAVQAAATFGSESGTTTKGAAAQALKCTVDIGALNPEDPDDSTDYSLFFMGPTSGYFAGYGGSPNPYLAIVIVTGNFKIIDGKPDIKVPKVTASKVFHVGSGVIGIKVTDDHPLFAARVYARFSTATQQSAWFEATSSDLNPYRRTFWVSVPPEFLQSGEKVSLETYATDTAGNISSTAHVNLLEKP